MEGNIKIDENIFWENAHTYSHETQDESFVSEMAYVMVTIHKTNS